MADMHIDGFDAFHYAARNNTRTLSRPNTDAPGRLGGNGLKRNRRQLQLLRKDPCVIKDSAFRAKYADIFEKQTTILSWTWKIYGIQYVKVDIRTNKPLNGHFQFRLSCRLRYRYRHQTRKNTITLRNVKGHKSCLSYSGLYPELVRVDTHHLGKQYNDWFSC